MYPLGPEKAKEAATRLAAAIVVLVVAVWTTVFGRRARHEIRFDLVSQCQDSLHESMISATLLDNVCDLL